MFEYQSVANINSVIWITSLNSQEIGSTERMIDTLQPFFVSIGLPFQHYHAATEADFARIIEIVLESAIKGIKPIIHIDTHGSESDGVSLVGSSSCISWQRLTDYLRPINIATKNNLCIVSAACFGFNNIKSVTINKATPFYMLIAPEKKVSFGFIEEHIPSFYEDVFKNHDILDAHKRHLVPYLRVFHSERMLAIGLAKYVYYHCTGAGRKMRIEHLLSLSIESGLINTRRNRQRARAMAKSFIRPSKTLIERYENSFLIGKKVGFTIKDISTLVEGTRANEDRERALMRRMEKL